MRTVGRKYRNMVKKYAKEAQTKGIVQYEEMWEYVKDKMPVEAFDSWESAYVEMENLTFDVCFGRA